MGVLSMKQEDMIRMAREAGLCPADDRITAIKEALAQPAQRPWVGLTDDEKIFFSTWLDYKEDHEVFTAIEAKLKEKNT
jgi:hypothetical protein